MEDVQVHEASDLPEAIPLLRRENPFDLILVDADSLEGYTRASLERAHDLPASTRIAILSVAHSRDEVFNCLADGFHGLIDKHQLDDEIISSLKDIFDGRIHVPTWIGDGDPERLSKPNALSNTLHTVLTPRQQSVLSLVAKGLSNKEIAYQLHISEGTTKIHTAALLRALGVRNRAEAVAKAGALLRRAPTLHHSPPTASNTGLNGGVRKPTRFVPI
jgi:DNA-binding NarL/FixJ family response regulator